MIDKIAGILRMIIRFEVIILFSIFIVYIGSFGASDLHIKGHPECWNVFDCMRHHMRNNIGYVFHQPLPYGE